MLTDFQWNLLEPHIPQKAKRKDGKGRPPKDPREVLDGILWILKTGAQWCELPSKYPPYQTCHRYFQAWNKNGVMRTILKELAEDLIERGEMDLSEESFIDGSFSSAKKRGLASERPRKEKAPKLWPLRTRMVFLPPYARQVLPLTKSLS